MALDYRPHYFPSLLPPQGDSKFVFASLQQKSLKSEKSSIEMKEVVGRLCVQVFVREWKS